MYIYTKLRTPTAAYKLCSCGTYPNAPENLDIVMPSPDLCRSWLYEFKGCQWPFQEPKMEVPSICKAYN